MTVEKLKAKKEDLDVHSLLAALMKIDMNGPDIEGSGRSEGANSGICQYVEEFEEEGAVKGQSRSPCAQKRPRDVEGLLSQLSGLEDVGFNDFIGMISFQKVTVKSRQVLHPFLPL